MLVAPLIWAVVVALTLRPPFRGGTRLGFAVYVLTMAVNELPMLFAALIVAGLLLNPGHPPTGVVAVAWLVLWAFVFAGLAWLQVRAGRARPALDAALTDALGPGWRATIPPQRAGRLRTAIPWASGILLPFQRRRAGVQRVRNLPYGPDPAPPRPLPG